MKYKIFFLVFIFVPILNWAQAPGCPSLEAGPAPTFHSSDTTICGPSNLTLTANVFHVGLTNTYTVSSIPYAPPYPFTSGTAIPISQDDYFGPVVNLPFKFCFFGQPYDKLVVGANGIITFDLSFANQYCSWSFSNTLPSTSLFKNAIFGAYHDIHPGVCGAFRYGVVGSYPCRSFIMNFDHVCHFSCTTIQSTLQVVLYEGTNVIEVHILNKPTCYSWNSGNAVIGIQNAAGTVAYVPPGRNTGPWTASNEAWRFTPNGAPSYTISWFHGANLLGYNAQQPVYVAQTDSFIAIATYEYCDGSQVIYRDTVHVYVNPQDIKITTTDSVLCLGESTTLNVAGGNSYTWNTGATTPSVTVSPTTSGYYSVTGTYMGTCIAVDSIYITVNQPPPVQVSATPSQICIGDSTQLNASGANSWTWSPAAGNNASVIVSPTTNTSYSVTGTDANGCTKSANVNVVVNPNPTIQMQASPPNGCEDLFVQFSANIDPPAVSYNWLFSDGTTSNQPTPAKVFTNPGKYDATLSVVTADGCTSSKTDLGIVDVYIKPVSSFIADSNYVTMDDPVVNFTDMSTNGATYYWDFNDFSSAYNYSNEASPSHTFSAPGDYIVWQTVYSEHGCSDKSYTVIHVQLNMFFYVPNAFSPYNADGINDVFKPSGVGVGLDKGSYIMNIYDRWGKIVFSSDDINKGWDGRINGRKQVPGIYSYRIEVQYGDGLWHVFNGRVTVLE
jgi:gliding motility-associated-like protein